MHREDTRWAWPPPPHPARTPRYLPMWFPPRPPPGYLPMWGAPGPSGLGALHWLHSLRHEKFMFSHALWRKIRKKNPKIKKKKSDEVIGPARLPPFFPKFPNSRVGTFPIAGALLAAAAAGETAPVAPAGTAVAAAETASSHGAWERRVFGFFWGEKKGFWGRSNAPSAPPPRLALPPRPRPPRPPPPPRLKSARRVAKDTLMGLPENSLPKNGRIQLQNFSLFWGDGSRWGVGGGLTVEPVDGGFGRGGVVEGDGGLPLQFARLPVRVEVDHGLPRLLVCLGRETTR